MPDASVWTPEIEDLRGIGASGWVAKELTVFITLVHLSTRHSGYRNRFRNSCGLHGGGDRRDRDGISRGALDLVDKIDKMNPSIPSTKNVSEMWIWVKTIQGVATHSKHSKLYILRTLFFLFWLWSERSEWTRGLDSMDSWTLSENQEHSEGQKIRRSGSRRTAGSPGVRTAGGRVSGEWKSESEARGAREQHRESLTNNRTPGLAPGPCVRMKWL